MRIKTAQSCHMILATHEIIGGKAMKGNLTRKTKIMRDAESQQVSLLGIWTTRAAVIQDQEQANHFTTAGQQTPLWSHTHMHTQSHNN